MVVEFKFYHKCWIYLTKKEREKMLKIIELLKEHTSLTSTELCKLLSLKTYRGKRNPIRCACYLLVAGRIINVRQKFRARVFRLNYGWQERLDRQITIVPYQRHILFAKPKKNKKKPYFAYVENRNKKK